MKRWVWARRTWPAIVAGALVPMVGQAGAVASPSVPGASAYSFARDFSTMALFKPIAARIGRDRGGIP